MSSIRRNLVDVNTSSDRRLPEPPSDTVSSMAWSPVNDYLAVASWDGSVRIYEVSATGDAQPRAMYSHEQMCLSVAWWSDGTKVVSGGGDNAVRSYDLASGQQTQVGQHDALITGVCVADVGQPVVASVSYDKTLKYWDLRSPQPVAVVQLPDRASHVVTAKKLLAVTLMNKKTLIFDLNNPTQVYKTLETTLKVLTESVAAMPDGSGLSQATSEGRCDVHYIVPPTPTSNFTFKCHRSTSTTGKPAEDVYNVGALDYHPRHGTLLTGGDDGVISIWDADSRSRVSTLKVEKAEPVTATAFNAQGTMLAYATGYNWAKGYQYNTADHQPTVRIHMVNDWEVKRKGK